MRKHTTLVFMACIISGFAVFLCSYGSLHHQVILYASDDAHEEGQTLYTCPMHPQIVQEFPGQCPICGMDLVPQKSPDQAKEEGAKQDVLLVDPVTVQNMGVRVDTVKRGIVHRHVRTFGRVETPDDAYAVVNLKFSGWAEKSWAEKQGAYVQKGEKLFAIYSPEVFSAQEEYILALKNFGPGHSITQSAENRFRLWDIADWQIQGIKDELKPRREIVITSPVSGFIEQVNVVEGSRISAGMDLYRIVNLEKVWLKAEVYDFDAPWIKEGAEAQVDFSIPGFNVYRGTISFVYPTLNFKTRTLTVRLELENPDVKLKPGMIAGVVIYGRSDDDRLIIPSESIISTGERRIVFVTETPGKYELREVETGLVGDNHVTEVISGLEEGETVVTSGQFLLDSESQLQEAVKKFLDAQLQSGRGESVADTGEHEEKKSGNILYTCPMHPQIVQEAPGQCPICGMDLVEVK